jgi:hypothetical protein
MRWLTTPMMLLLSITVGNAQDSVPKQVHLVNDGDRLVASNIRFSRFDEFKLGPRERVLESAVGEAVISGWRAIDRSANEKVVSIVAEDYAGLVVTSQRLLNFNGESGVWGEHDRAVGR